MARYEEDDFDDEHDFDDEDDDATLGAALGAEWETASWHMISAGVHIVVLILLMLLIKEPPPIPEEAITITNEVVVEEEVIEEEVKEEPEIEELEQVVETEVQVETITPSEVEVVTDTVSEVETETEAEAAESFDDPADVMNVTEVFTVSPATMGIGGGGSFGNGGKGAFGMRSGSGKRGALRKGGGGKNTENAVSGALRWLATHQEPNGNWDCQKYEGGNHDAAVTALATLAFLGAGHTPEAGTYRKNVRAAVDYLLGTQEANGLFAKHRYEHPIVMMALAEAYAMSDGGSRKKAMGEAVEAGLYYAKETQKHGGWHYTPNDDVVDMSVLGWWAMGIKSAKSGGIHVDPELVSETLNGIHNTYMEYGKVAYHSGPGGKSRPTTNLTAVYCTVAQFFGDKPKEDRVAATADLIVAEHMKYTPEAYDLYGVYYQALGLFQTGVRGKNWEAFNPYMKDLLTTAQRKDGTYEQFKGSFDPNAKTHGAEKWGRVGQTAVAALCLEVYYRYASLKH